MPVTANELAALGISPPAAAFLVSAINSSGAVVSVNGKTGVVTLAAKDVGALEAVPVASQTAIGGVKMSPNQANVGASTATDIAGVVSDLNAFATKYNGLLSALQAAGLIAAS